MSGSDLEDRLRRLEARLESVEAVAEIQGLKARYAELVDARYAEDGPRTPAELAGIAERIAALFTEDAVWDGGARLGLRRGRDEIRERFLEPTLGFTLHYFIAPRIDVEGSRARGRWEILAPLRLPDGRPGWMAGYEDDEYRRLDGRWLHSRMQLTVRFIAPHDRGW